MDLTHAVWLTRRSAPVRCLVILYPLEYYYSTVWKNQDREWRGNGGHITRLIFWSIREVGISFLIVVAQINVHEIINDTRGGG
jgi:hypothetical protein